MLATPEVPAMAARALSPSVLRPVRRLAGEVVLPSDKSIAHRALIFCALAAGDSTIRLRQPGADVRSTIAALASLGVPVALVESDAGLLVSVGGLGEEGALGRLAGGQADCGNSGTTMRLLTGALASGRGRAVLSGDSSLGSRPMERVAGPLRAMGALIETADGHAPLQIDGRWPLRAGGHELPMASAQVLGAICLAALAADGVTTVRVPGPTRDHTERMLRGMGALVERQALAGGGSVTTVHGPAELGAVTMQVPADFSSTAAWIVAAAIHPDAEVRLPAVGLNPTRTALLDLLREMGADIDITSETDAGGEPVGDVQVRSCGRLRAVSVGPELVPALIDELPLIAVAMAAADGTSEVRGATELRLKESDRISAMSAALTGAGARVEELSDGWRISPGRPADAHVATLGDHRIAMAMAVAAWSGLAQSVSLDETDSVAVSYPSFWTDAAALGALA
ncbi:3-phosphoshikimate 1-carboxyvinyltransferase [soil metagenome]